MEVLTALDVTSAVKLTAARRRTASLAFLTQVTVLLVWFTLQRKSAKIMH